MPTLIILGVFENITHTGTEFVGQSDIAEKGGDDWILGFGSKFSGVISPDHEARLAFSVYIRLFSITNLAG